LTMQVHVGLNVLTSQRTSQNEKEAKDTRDRDREMGFANFDQAFIHFLIGYLARINVYAGPDRQRERYIHIL
jgi:hypothetical protein